MSTPTSLTIRTAERPGGNKPSEDRIYRSNNAVIVLDGATQPIALARTGGWFAEQIGKRLVAGLDEQPDVNLQDLVASTIKRNAEHFDLTPGVSPSCTISIVRFDGDEVDVFVLCDSPVVVLDRRDQVHEVRDNRLAQVRSSLDRPDGLRNMDDPSWFTYYHEFEAHRNQPNGFWVASATPEAAEHATIERFSLDEINTILMMTDGVSAIVDDYAVLPSWVEVIGMARRDPNRLINFVHTTELSDPEAVRWPRGKMHDDKALVVVSS